MKTFFYPSLLFFITFVSTISAKELSCSHYLNVNVHSSYVNLIQWQQNIKIDLGVNDKVLNNLLLKNKETSDKILSMLDKKQDSLAKIEIERLLGKTLTAADNMRDISLKLARSAFLEKELIKNKHDKYSDISLKQFSKIEFTEKDDLVVTEGLIVEVFNNLSKVRSTYFHGLNNNSLFIPDSSPRTLNEYNEDLTPFKIKDPIFGEIKAISYKCTYPDKSLTSGELEQEYLKLITKAQSNLSELKANINKQTDNIHIKESEEINQQNSAQGKMMSK